MDSMKNHDASFYDSTDELPPINGGAKMKSSKYSVSKQSGINKGGQNPGMFGGGSTTTSLKPKGVIPVTNGGGGGGSNGSSTNRSGVFPTSVSTSTKASKKTNANTMQQQQQQQLPLKKVANPSKLSRKFGS